MAFGRIHSTCNGLVNWARHFIEQVIEWALPQNCLIHTWLQPGGWRHCGSGNRLKGIDILDKSNVNKSAPLEEILLCSLSHWERVGVRACSATSFSIFCASLEATFSSLASRIPGESIVATGEAQKIKSLQSPYKPSSPTLLPVGEGS